MGKHHLQRLVAGCVLLSAVLFPSVGRATDDVARLAGDPDQLRRVEEQCRNDWAATGDALCAAASKARRERFLGRHGDNKPRRAETADPKSRTGEAD